MVQSLSSRSTALSWSCWKTLLFLLENKCLSEESHSFPAEVWKSKILAWFDLRINPGLVIFCEKHSIQNLFCRSFKAIQQIGHALLSYRKLRYKSECWFSIKMLPKIKTNPTAWRKTLHWPVNSLFIQEESRVRDQCPNQTCIRRLWSQEAWRLPSPLIPGSPQCLNNPLRPLAEASTEMLQFDELTFSEKNLFPASLPSSSKITISKDLSNQPPSQLPCYHKPPGWPKTKSCASTRESLSLCNQSHFPKFRIC